jgi:hypothetical protein
VDRGERHRDAERERNPEERLRQREEALEERIDTSDDDRRIVVRLVASTIRNAQNARAAATATASQAGTSPTASGRRAVRSTCGSNRRSAQSLIAQPAERIRSVPIVNTSSCVHVGRPAAASHSAPSVGQSSSSVPIGLSSRTSRS